MFRRSSTFSVVSTFSDFPTNFRSYRAPRAQQCQRALHFDSFLFWSLADDCYFLGLPHSVLSISSSPHVAKIFKSKLVLFVYAFSWSFFCDLFAMILIRRQHYAGSNRANIVNIGIHVSRTVEIAMHNCMLPRQSVSRQFSQSSFLNSFKTGFIANFLIAVSCLASRTGLSPIFAEQFPG